MSFHGLAVSTLLWRTDGTGRWMARDDKKTWRRAIKLKQLQTWLRLLAGNDNCRWRVTWSMTSSFVCISRDLSPISITKFVQNGHYSLEPCSGTQALINWMVSFLTLTHFRIYVQKLAKKTKCTGLGILAQNSHLYCKLTRLAKSWQ